MRSRFMAFAFLLILLGLFGLFVHGCTQAAKDQTKTILDNVSQATSPVPSSNPSTQPAVIYGQVAVKTIEEFIPVSTAIFSLVSGVTGLAAGLIGGAKAGAVTATAQAATKQANYAGALTEILDDVAAFKQPGVNWSTATQKLLSDAVGAFHPAVAVVTPSGAPAGTA